MANDTIINVKKQLTDSSLHICSIKQRLNMQKYKDVIIINKEVINVKKNV